jgi:hypothetical protein
MSYNFSTQPSNVSRNSQRGAFSMEAAKIENEMKTLVWFSKIRKLNDQETLRLARLKCRAEELAGLARRQGWA